MIAAGMPRLRHAAQWLIILVQDLDLVVAQVKQIQLVPVIPDQQIVLRIHVAPFDQRLVIGR